MKEFFNYTLFFNPTPISHSFSTLKLNQSSARHGGKNAYIGVREVPFHNSAWLSTDFGQVTQLSVKWG